MNQRSERKKATRQKTEGKIKHISQPFDFRHDLHIGHDNNEEGRTDIDDRPESPPAPCPGNKDNAGDTSELDTSISQIIKEEIIPAIRFEIGDIVEEKIRKILNERNQKSETRHCKPCLCTENERQNNDEQDIRLIRNPNPCTAIFVEDSDVLQNSAGVKVITATDMKVIEGEKKFLKSFSNPVYHQKGQTLLIQTQHGAKLLRCGPSNTPPRFDILARQTKSIQPSELKSSIKPNQKGRLLPKSDERECLAHALQWHVKELVDGIVFKDSELPDSMLQDGCLTEDECASIRNKLDRKDQVRVLLCVMKGRDFDILKRFLKHIRSHNEDVANSIEEKFEQNKKEGKRCTKCVICKLTSRVNLKYIVDDLWRNDLIDDGLFNMIVQTDKPTGAQDELWHGVLYSLNKYCSQSPSDVRHMLGETLTRRNHYVHLAQAVDWFIYTHEEMMCHCELQKKTGPLDSFPSLISSRSPASSLSEFETDSQCDENLLINSIDGVVSTDHIQESVKQDKASVERNKLKEDIVCEDKSSLVAKPEQDRPASRELQEGAQNSGHVTGSKSEQETNKSNFYTNHSPVTAPKSECIRLHYDNKLKDSRVCMTTSDPEPGNDQKAFLLNKPYISPVRAPITRQQHVLNDDWEISVV